MKIVVYIVGGILSLIALMILLFGMNFLGLEMSGILGKRAEEIRHEIQMESTAHIQGMQRNLQSMMNDYNSADQAGKAGIIASVKHQYSQEDTSNYPQYLKDFLRKADIY